jgi:hypothetical protein
MSEPLFESTAPKYHVLFWRGDSEYEVERFNKLGVKCTRAALWPQFPLSCETVGATMPRDEALPKHCERQLKRELFGSAYLSIMSCHQPPIFTGGTHG